MPDRQRPAHRIAYELVVAPVPAELDLDHLCRVRRCVNPAHVEPATRQVNLLRGVGHPAVNAAKTHCPKGHPFDDANTYHWEGHRQCRACRFAADKRYRDRLRERSLEKSL
jgi:hypothetical protein